MLENLNFSRPDRLDCGFEDGEEVDVNNVELGDGVKASVEIVLVAINSAADVDIGDPAVV